VEQTCVLAMFTWHGSCMESSVWALHGASWRRDTTCGIVAVRAVARRRRWWWLWRKTWSEVELEGGVHVSAMTVTLTLTLTVTFTFTFTLTLSFTRSTMTLLSPLLQ
jgi:hypothetical protein